MKSFQDYKKVRDSLEFDIRFNSLCESIALSGMSFDEFWENHALPALLQSCSFSDEFMLMNEFAGPVSQATGNALGNSVFGNLGGKVRSMGNAVKNWLNGPQPVQPNPAEVQRQEKLQNFQNTVNQHVASIQKLFTSNMHTFLKQVSDKAKTDNNPHMWQIAQSFYNRILQAANQFKMTAQYGKADYVNQFNQQRQAMQQSMKNNNPYLQKLRAQNQANKQAQSLGSVPQEIPEINPT
jgi:hypothetical protein